jgi:hypothetical protein
MAAVAFYSSLIAPFAYFCCYCYAWPKLVGQWRREHPVTGMLSTVLMGAILLCFQIAQHFYASLGQREVWPGISVNVGSSILFPLSLAILLHLCITRSAFFFRDVCLFLVGVNTVLAAITCVIRSGAFGPELPTWSAPLWTTGATLQIVLGTILLLFDAAFMVLSFAFACHQFHGGFMRLAFPLTCALALDAAGFSGVRAITDGVPYYPTVLALAVSKLLSGLVYAGCLAWYFRNSDLRSIGHNEETTGQFWMKVFPFMLRTPWRRWMDVVRRRKPANTSSKPAQRIPKKPQENTGLTTYRPSATETQVGAWDSEKPLNENTVSGAVDVGEPLLEKDFLYADAVRAQTRLQQQWQSLLDTHYGKWVAFGPDGMIHSAENSEKLDDWLMRLNLKPGTYIIRQIVPWFSVGQATIGPQGRR